MACLLGASPLSRPNLLPLSLSPSQLPPCDLLSPPGYLQRVIASIRTIVATAGEPTHRKLRSPFGRPRSTSLSPHIPHRSPSLLPLSSFHFSPLLSLTPVPPDLTSIQWPTPLLIDSTSASAESTGWAKKSAPVHLVRATPSCPDG